MNKTIKELINNKQNNYIIKLLKIASDKIILPLRGNLKKDQMLLAMKKMVPIALCKLENEKIKPFRVFNF